MNVYEHCFSASTLPGQAELRNKEPEFALRQALCARRAASCEYAPLWSSWPWPDPGFSLPSKQILEEPKLEVQGKFVFNLFPHALRPSCIKMNRKNHFDSNSRTHR